MGSRDADAAGARPNENDGVTWKDVVEFAIDVVIMGGVPEAGRGSDIVPRAQPGTLMTTQPEKAQGEQPAKPQGEQSSKPQGD
jgi:hypothetical protein